MLLRCGIILLSFYNILPKCYGMNNEEFKEFLHLTELRYEENCNKTATAEWMFINDPTNHNLLLEWEKAQAMYSWVKKIENADIHNQTGIEIDDELLRYKLTVAEKPGDMLLNATQWAKLVSFSGEATVLRTGMNRTDQIANHPRSDIEQLLSGNAKLEDKRSAWSNWHRQLSPLLETYSSTLGLASEAAKANGADSVASYWELLSGYTDGYEKIKLMWEDILELHRKVVTFVKNRLALKYKITLADGKLPAYLLGSLDGNDWTLIADDILPFGNVTYSIIKNLWEKDLRGNTLYKSASKMGKSVLKDNPVSDFWQNSRFNQTCSTKLINFCREGVTRVSTCYHASLGNFLTSHKVVAKVLVNQIKAGSFPFLNTANRYSGLDEGISELFSILSVSPGQLQALKLISNSTTTDESKITSLMITALDVLPRLAYYIATDLWRIDVIKNGTLAPNQLIESWWKYREQYERVTSDSSDLPSFLDDDFITSNKPYLSKFVGTIFAFQLYEELTESVDVRYDVATKYQTSRNLISILRNDGANDWTKVIDKILSTTNEISTSAMRSFFSPLEEFLDNNVEIVYSLTTSQEADLDRLERLHELSDVTTTPVPTTTSAPTLATMDPKQPPKKTNSSLPITPPINPTNPVVEPSSKDKTAIKKPNVFSHQDELEDSEDNYPDKMNTSKAVWAVGVVLVATVTICIIAIFGRRRCVKSQMPKNRRYV